MKSIFIPLIPLVVSYLALGLCTFLFKKRTPEEYAASAARGTTPFARFFWKRWTPLWQFMGAVGPDPAKAAEALTKVITGKVMPVAIGVVAVDEKKLSSAPAPVVKSDDDSGPYRDGILSVLALVGALSLTQASCTPAGQQTAKDVTNAAISAASLACIFASVETDAPAVAQICGVTQDLIPIVRQLIGQREGARRAGVRWAPATDAGAP